MDFSEFLIYTSIFSPVAGILIGIHRGLLKDKILKYILILLILSFFSDITMFFLAKNGLQNLPIYKIYTLFEGVLLFIFFKNQLKNYARFINILLSLYIACYIVDVIFITSVFEFSTYTSSLESLFMIGLAITFFYNIYVNETNIFIEKNPDFLIVIGIFFYFSIAFFSFMLSSDILSQSPDRFYGSWIIHNTANILKNILFTLALWKAAGK